MHKIRIVFLTPGVNTGGAEKQLAILAKGLKACGFEPIIISLTKVVIADALPDFFGIRVIECDCKLSLGLASSILRLRKVIKDHKPHIIQGWMYGGNILASIFGYGFDAQIYHALRASNMDGKRYGKIIWLNSLLASYAKAVVANSFAGAEHHISIGYDVQRMHVISNGINTKIFTPNINAGRQMRKRLSIREDEFVFLYVARIDPMKAHEKIIAVAQLCPKIKFVFAGSGTEHLEVPQNVILLGLSNEMPELYNAADWLLSLSNFGEGFPNVIGEAMACGLPVCANDVGDSHFIMADTGHLCASDSPEQIAKQITKIAKIKVTKSVRKQLVNRIQNHFSVDSMINDYWSLYNKNLS